MTRNADIPFHSHCLQLNELSPVPSPASILLRLPFHIQPMQCFITHTPPLPSPIHRVDRVRPSVSVAIGSFLESETAPWAGGWRVLVSPVQLDVLHWVAQAHPLHTRAPNHIAMHLHDRHLVDQLLRIRHVRRRRQLHRPRRDSD